MRPGWIALTLLAGWWPAAAQQYTIATFAGGVPPATPVAAVSTSIGAPRRVAADSAGNVYFSSLNSVFKLDTSGVLTLIAGNSRPGFSGDGGPAAAAALNNPQGVAVDASGNVYIADSGNSRIRMVSSAGVISTFAGTGVAGYSGNYGPASGAQFNLPAGLAFDGNGNLFIADTGNSVIREITPDGTITPFAGTGFQGYVGDTGAATVAALSIPTDVAVDSKGNVYIADTGNSVVRQVTPDGNIYTLAGNGTNGYTGDSLASNAAQLNGPRGVAVDSSGNVYIADFNNYRIRKATPNTLAPTVTVNPSGTTTVTYNTNSVITTIAGNGSNGFAGDGSAATGAMMAGPWGIALDSSGNLYVADVFNARVRKIASGGSISTVAGNGLLSYSGDGGAASRAQLFGPRGVAVDAQGNLYIADTSNNRVRKVASGGVITTLAGNGAAGFGGDGAAAASAQLNQPVALAVDASGNLYIADFANNRVRMVNPSGIISTVAGNGTGGFGGDGSAASSAQLNGPTALAVDRSGNVYVSDFTNNRVRKFTPGGTIATVAGNGLGGFGGDGGPAVNALLDGPYGLAVDAAGNLYICDLNNSRIRMVTPGGTISTFAGNGIAAIGGDGGPVSQATLAAPQSLLLDSAGNLYVGDSVGRVRMISSAGSISTIVGKGPAGYSGDGGSATLAQINGPSGLAVDAVGNLYIADTFNNAVRRAPPIFGITPTINAIANGASNAMGAIAPGEVVTIYGTGLGPVQLTQSELGADGRVPTSVTGTQILFNGIAAPILYAWTNQVGAIVPFGVTGSAQVVAQNGNRSSAPLTAQVAAYDPALFTADSTGQRQAVANNANGTRNSAATPAAPGSIITLIATGFGPTHPPLADGSMGPADVASLAVPVSVTIGGQAAQAGYAIAAPGIVAGVIQINVTVPFGVAAGSAVPVELTILGASSPAGVTIAVGQ